jgi:RNA polymerase sigma-70 factor (ECF subfamily)
MPDSREYDILAEQSRRGDARALATLYRHLAPSLLGYLQRMLGERADAEDVLHDTFIRMFEGRGQYKGKGHFRSWLYTVATRLAIDRVRRRRRHSELVPRVREETSRGPSSGPGEDLAYRELLERLESALADVPATYAMAFHLRVQEGFSYREIAAICGDAEGTLRSRVHHTLKQVRKTLTEGDTGDPGRMPKEEEPR